MGTEDVFGNSILANGVVVSGGNVHQSILFRDVFIDDRARVNQSILFSDVYVGKDAELQNYIVEKNVRIPANTKIGINYEKDKQRFTLSDNGIVVISEGCFFIKAIKLFKWVIMPSE